MHQGALKYHSAVFRDMFEAGTGSGKDAVPVAEPAEVLAQVLPYCYHERVPPVDCVSASFWPLVKTFDKYEVSPPPPGRWSG